MPMAIAARGHAAWGHADGYRRSGAMPLGGHADGYRRSGPCRLGAMPMAIAARGAGSAEWMCKHCLDFCVSNNAGTLRWDMCLDACLDVCLDACLDVCLDVCLHVFTCV